MLIKYTPKTNHIKCVPLVTTDDNIKLTRAQVELSPGINEVSENEWVVMQTILAGDNEITVVKTESKSTAEKPKHARALKDVSASQAAEIVKNCSSGQTLKKWYRTETREIVLLAILNRLKKLNIDPFENSEDDPPPAVPSADDDGDNPGKETEEKETKGNEGGGNPLDKMNKEELLAFAAQKGITVAGSKEEIRAALKAVVENKRSTQ
jgi:hypothetical protein